MEALYIHGNVSEDKLVLTIPSAVVYFVHEYSQSSTVPIYVMPVDVSTCVSSFPYKHHDENLCIMDSTKDVDSRLNECSLPAAKLEGGLVITSGLCSVLRHIVKSSSLTRPHDNLLDLLGHKELCLKSCAEVSAWTKFCEVEMIKITEVMCKKAMGRSHFSDHGSSPHGLPEEIFRLENHLQEPPIIRNIGKKRIQLAKELKDSKSEITVNSLLEHNYMEGIEFTLTDLILYFCVHSMLQKRESFLGVLMTNVPNVYKWYLRVGCMEKVRHIVKELHLGDDLININHNKIGDTGLDNSASSVDAGVCFSQDLVHGKAEHAKRSVNERRHGKKKFKASAVEISEVLGELGTRDLLIPHAAHPCEGAMPLPWREYPPAVHPQEGELPPQRVHRKCEQLESLATAVQVMARPGDTVVDFCSGGGHLGILLAHLLPDCRVVMVENKEESIQRAVARVRTLGLSNVSIFQTNLDYYTGSFDFGVCLHACGVATDLVLQRCLENRASFVICPCCYGSIKRTHTMDYPRSKLYRESGFTYDRYLVLAHGGDQTQTSIPTAAQGKACMTGVDSDRARLAQEAGYSVTLCALQPLSCSPKNNIIIGELK